MHSQGPAIIRLALRIDNSHSCQKAILEKIKIRIKIFLVCGVKSLFAIIVSVLSRHNCRFFLRSAYFKTKGISTGVSILLLSHHEPRL